ncbi:MAG TPA: TIGR04282 family arsenosugar biosynthesis glycosyltransferase [Thermoanaerobaculia bacterium]|nr:TIGR04282 family arsenosugar biosynthesis glycosyltransferase [Thermoanaerobaculia bacterium]
MNPGDRSGAGPCLVLFAKPAVPGRVKTRLIGALSARQAAQLHAAFVGDLSARLGAARCALWSAWALTEDEDPPLELLGAPAPPLRQAGADLGERMHAALRAAAAAGHDPVAAVGSDHPTLSVERVAEAWRRIDEGADVAIGPATDGGYYLLACRAAALGPELFSGVDWSTDRVLDQTLERCARSSLRVALLEPESDVDTPADLERLLGELAAAPGRCPRTERLLAAWGLA